MSMGSQPGPQVGEISSDGQFRWNGQDWTPLARGHRVPTSWTLALRRATAAYLLLSAAVAVVTNALFETRAAVARSIHAASPHLTDEQVQASVSIGYAFGWVVVGVIVVGAAVLALGSYRGWRWAFWADLVVLAIGAIQVITNALALRAPATQILPPGAVAVDLVLSLLALALLVWFVVAAVRFGPWAMRRPAPPEPR